MRPRSRYYRPGPAPGVHAGDEGIDRLLVQVGLGPIGEPTPAKPAPVPEQEHELLAGHEGIGQAHSQVIGALPGIEDGAGGDLVTGEVAQIFVENVLVQGHRLADIVEGEIAQLVEGKLADKGLGGRYLAADGKVSPLLGNAVKGSK